MWHSGSRDGSGEWVGGEWEDGEQLDSYRHVALSVSEGPGDLMIVHNDKKAD